MRPAAFPLPPTPRSAQSADGFPHKPPITFRLWNVLWNRFEKTVCGVIGQAAKSIPYVPTRTHLTYNAFLGSERGVGLRPKLSSSSANPQPPEGSGRCAPGSSLVPNRRFNEIGIAHHDECTGIMIFTTV
jgi:hypothetical protein